MTNYDMIKNMSAEEMAERRIRILDIGRNVYYISSDQCVSCNKEDAVQHETAWLNSECEVVE